VDDDGGLDSARRSRRRRDADANGGLSVADLLARHGSADVPGSSGSAAAPGAGVRHRLGEWPVEDPEPADSSDGFDRFQPRAARDDAYPGWADDQFEGFDDFDRPDERDRRDRPGEPGDGGRRDEPGRRDQLSHHDLREDYLVPYRTQDVDQGMTDRLFPAGAVFALSTPPEQNGSGPAVPPAEPATADAPAGNGRRRRHALIEADDEPDTGQSSAGQGGALGDADPDDSPTAVVPRTVLPVVPDHVVVDLESHDGQYDDGYDDSYDADEDADGSEETVRTGAVAPPKDAVESTGPRAVEPADSAEPAEETGVELRARRIDESLTRLTAIHAGLGLEMTERVSRSHRLAVVDRTGGPPADGAEDADAAGGEPPRHPGLLRAGRIAALVVTVLLFVGTASAWGIQAWLNAKLPSVNALDPDATTIVDLAGQAGDQNFLLVGVDPKTAAQSTGGQPSGPSPLPDQPALPPQLALAGPAAGGPGVSGGGLDSIMLVHVPVKADRAVVLSFPAGLAVDRPSCDRWDPVSGGLPGGTSPAQPNVPLSASYAVGGPRCLTKAVQQLTGLSINHYTGLDVTGLAAVVDAVRGVPVCLGGPAGGLSGSDGGTAPAAGGPAVLGGAQAVDFVGATPSAASLAAGGQAQRQQLFVTALLRKATSDQMLLHLGQLRGFVSAFSDHSRSDNASLGQLATLAQSLQHLDPSKIFLATAPTAAAPDQQGNQALAGDPAKALFDAIRADQTLPGESAATGGPTEDDSTQALKAGAVPPSAVTLTVRNGSARTGLAGQAADLLRPLGFTITAVGDSPPTEGGRTIIRHSADRADQAATLADAVPSAVSETVPGSTGLLDLVLGDSFGGQVKASSVAGAGAAAPAGLRTLSSATGTCP
jgi:LCP family protein required for cell wall assembly